MQGIMYTGTGVMFHKKNLKVINTYNEWCIMKEKIQLYEVYKSCQLLPCNEY